MIQWLEARRTQRRGKEVRVVTTPKKNAYVTSVIFYGNAHRKITKADRIGVGIDGGRMYFSQHQDTFKICKYSAKDAAQVNLPGKKDKFVGEYDLQFDAEQQLWYIGV